VSSIFGLRLTVYGLPMTGSNTAKCDGDAACHTNQITAKQMRKMAKRAKLRGASARRSSRQEQKIIYNHDVWLAKQKKIEPKSIARFFLQSSYVFVCVCLHVCGPVALLLICLVFELLLSSQLPPQIARWIQTQFICPILLTYRKYSLYNL